MPDLQTVGMFGLVADQFAELTLTQRNAADGALIGLMELIALHRMIEKIGEIRK